MLAYAANRPLAGKRESSPNALLLVISAHVALLAVVMSAKMDLPRRIWHAPPLIPISIPPVPPPNQSAPKPRHVQPRNQTVDHPVEHVPMSHQPVDPHFDTQGPPNETPPASGGGTSPFPVEPKPLPPLPVFRDPHLLTPASELRPPYPASKLASEEEATLQLRLTIDDHGGVIAVDPVGYADHEFLASARRYIIAHWRYQPASQDGRAVPSVLTVTLRFQLDG